MKQAVKKAGALMLLICMFVSMSACNATKFDAAGYVKAYLDAIYYQEYEAFAEFTEQTEEEAKQGIVEIEKADLVDSYDDLELTDEELDQYYQTVNEIYHTVKYEVKEAEETEDKNYLVTIEITPVDTYKKFNSGINDKMMEVFADATEVPSDQEILNFTLDYMRECSQAANYEEAVTIQIEVTHDDDYIYSISDEDMDTIEAALMPEA